MESYMTVVDTVFKWPRRRDDDIYDRLNSRYTVAVLVGCAAIVTFYQFTGSPVTCWAPKHFTDAHAAYTNSFCWVNSTYYLPFSARLPVYSSTDKEKVRYYQWVTFMLLAQAMGFYLPYLVWYSWCRISGLDCDSILSTAYKLTKTETEKNRQNVLDLLINQLERFLRKGRNKTSNTCCGGRCERGRCGRRSSCHLTVLYLLCKVLYIANIVVQIRLLDGYLHKDYTYYGIEVMKGLASDHDWHNQPLDIFPRVTLCDMPVRVLGNVNTYTLQCSLNQNLFNEKIYMFIWFWYLLVGLLSVFGLVQWLLRVVCWCDRRNHVRNQLGIRGNPDKLDKFTREYLGQDGALVLRLISHNTNSITSREIVKGLWQQWLKKDGKTGETLEINGNLV